MTGIDVGLLDTIYADLCKARASAFSTLTLLDSEDYVGDSMPPAVRSTLMINCEISMEYCTLAISKTELTDQEREQENIELYFLRQAGFLRDNRFKDLGDDEAAKAAFIKDKKKTLEGDE